MAGASIDRRKVLKLAGVAGASGVALAAGRAGAAGATTGGFGFVPINPYRSYDSRPGQLGTNDTVDIDLITDERSVLRIPADALAVTYNLTIANTVGSGFIAVYPADIAYPGNSSINWWTSNLLLANGGVVAIGESADTGPGSVTFLCGGGGASAFLIDITSYYI